jgi:CPA2 family monovalent cation:H+ antiporter-2
VLIQVSSLLSIRLFSQWGPEPAKEEKSPPSQLLSEHVIIAGYGLIGRTLSRVLRETNIPLIILDIDSDSIKHALTEKMTAIYGDATHRGILTRAGIKKAKMMVFAFPDNIVTQQGIKLARQLNPRLYILVRTRYASQVEELKAAGADQVIPEEFETSVEIFSRVLREYRIPTNVIEQQVELARLEGYSMFRGLSLSIESMKKFSTFLTANLTQSFQVQSGFWCDRKTLDDLQLRKKTGARVIAVVRSNEVHPNPDPQFSLTSDDILILFGRHAQLDQSVKILESGGETELREPGAGDQGE